ncbi:MAG: hypothetical protein RR339_03605 [Bacteroidales bacterium]
MKAKRKIKKYLTKGFRKVRYRKGFGVHSPFAYSLITQVIGEQTPFYAYEEILQLKKRYSLVTAILPKFVSRRMPSTKLLYLLYRLVNRFNPQHLLELDNHGGLVTYVLGLPNTQSEVISIGNDPEKMARTRSLFESEKPHNGLFIEEDVIGGLRNLPADYKADFVYVHLSAARRADDLYACLRKRIHAHSVIVIEGIKTDKDARRLWNYFRYSPEVSVSMDLYEVGLAICHERLYKQHYIVSF